MLTLVSNVTAKIKHNSKIRENGFEGLFLHTVEDYTDRSYLFMQQMPLILLKLLHTFIQFVGYFFYSHDYQTVSGFSTMAACITLGFTMVFTN